MTFLYYTEQHSVPCPFPQYTGSPSPVAAVSKYYRCKSDHPLRHKGTENNMTCWISWQFYCQNKHLSTWHLSTPSPSPLGTSCWRLISLFMVVKITEFPCFHNVKGQSGSTQITCDCRFWCWVWLLKMSAGLTMDNGKLAMRDSYILYRNTLCGVL